MIELKQITAGYGNHEVLRNASVCFEKGKLTSLIGVNGCGKSTLLKSILGMIRPSVGEIIVDGRELGSMTRNEIAKKVALLPQGKNTPDMTVEQMVLHGRFPHLNYPRRYTKRDRDIALAAMRQMGIADHAGKPLYALSGGMRQNAYIAMALAQSTDYILLDEPTTYLDIVHQLELMNIMRDLAADGKGIVAVMHDLPMAFTFSDRIVLLNEGRVIADDVPEQLCRKNTIQQLFGVAIGKSTDGQSYTYQFSRQ